MSAEGGRLPTRIKIFHGFGSIAYGVKENGFSTFLLLFYNQVLGMDAWRVSIALLIAMVIDAFLDPIIGHASDRTYSRFGRRLPWLYAAAIPLSLAWLALWNPPTVEGWAGFAWLTGTAVVVRGLISCCEVPSVAILPELTQDYDERTQLMSMRYLFGWIGGLVIAVLAYSVFLVSDEPGVVGQLQPEGYSNYAISGAVLMGLAVLISARGQHKRLAHLPASRPEPTTAREALGHIWEAVSHPAFLVLASCVAMGSLSAQVTFALSNYLYIFVWKFPEIWFRYYPLLLLFSVLIAIYLVSHSHRKHGKRNAVARAVVIGNFFWATPFLLRLAGFWPEAGSDLSTALVFGFFFMGNLFAVIVSISLGSMIAEVVEASEEATGRRSEGVLYAGNLFVQKCATGLGILLSGLIIDFAGLEAKADPAKVPANVVDTLTLIYIVMVLVLASGLAWRVRHFPITRDDHEERLRILAERRSAA